MITTTFLLALLPSLSVSAGSDVWISESAAVQETVPRSLAIVTNAQEVLSGAPVGLRVVGAPPGSKVTVTAERSFGYAPLRTYRSRATFTANEAGEVDLQTAAPDTAPWDGVDPRGLFWSMTATEEIVGADGPPRTEVRFFVDIDGDDVFDASAKITLLEAARTLERTPVPARFPGACFVRPPGDEKLPVIIVLGGSEGNDFTSSSMAPKLASRGYAVFGLPYYSPAYGTAAPNFPDLPGAFHNIPIDRLEDVVKWVREQPGVRGDRIGLYGVSKGAEFVLAAATRMDDFSAVAAIAPSDVIWEGWGPGTTEGQSSSFSWRGEPLAFVPYVGMNDTIARRAKGESLTIRAPHDDGRRAYPERVAAARIAVETIDEPVLVVGGDKDVVWDSGGMARRIAKAREAAGLSTISIVGTDAGHWLSGDGYMPVPETQARVHAQAFPALLRFYDQHLRLQGQEQEAGR